MINIRNVSKSFRIPVRDAGTGAALKAFFNRRYKEINALDDISFNINKGEIVGYIGPNGAGKSTSIKIMCGILKQDSGSCTVNGIDPFQKRKEHAQNIGVVFGQRSQLWWDIPVIDSFALLRETYRIPQDDYEQRLHELVTRLELQDIVQMPTRQLSLGQRMRCEIVASLLHNPKVLFLDEPTIGLDAVSKVVVRDFIKDINQRYQTTVILTTHDMQDIESLATRVILIGKGKILFDGGMDQLKDQYKLKKTIRIQYEGATLEKHELYKIINDENNMITLEAQGDISSVLAFIADKIQIRDIEIKDAPIDSIILNMYRELKI